MKCLLCEGPLVPHLVKDFGGACALEEVQYARCRSCGTVVAENVHRMSAADWVALNARYHASFHGNATCDDDPRRGQRLADQARALLELVGAGLLRTETPWIDYGCGDGTMGRLMRRRGVEVLDYDPFSGRDAKDYVSEEALRRTYDVVICTSVFEHVRDVDTLDQIAGLVSAGGVLAVHVLVREEIPADPQWFYLLPVHCTLFTNRGMQILFERWGFSGSIYHLPSRMWFWFRGDASPAKGFAMARPEGEPPEYFFKDAFVDYWK